MLYFSFRIAQSKPLHNILNLIFNNFFLLKLPNENIMEKVKYYEINKKRYSPSQKKLREYLQ